MVIISNPEEICPFLEMEMEEMDTSMQDPHLDLLGLIHRRRDSLIFQASTLVDQDHPLLPVPCLR